jgi:hypothetical protein
MHFYIICYHLYASLSWFIVTFLLPFPSALFFFFKNFISLGYKPQNGNESSSSSSILKDIINHFLLQMFLFRFNYESHSAYLNFSSSFIIGTFVEWMNEWVNDRDLGFCDKSSRKWLSPKSITKWDIFSTAFIAF